MTIEDRQNKKTYPVSIPRNNKLVVQSNQLIESCHKLSVIQHKIVRILITQINDKDTIYQLDITDLCEKLGYNQRQYTLITENIKDLTTKRIVFDRKGKVYCNWLSSLEIMDDGMIEVELSDKLHSLLYELKSNFTQYEIKHIYGFKNKYSQRIYDLLIQYKNVSFNKNEENKTRYFSIEDVRFKLNIRNIYPRFYSIQQKILEPVCKEINEQTNINVCWRKHKKGRKLIGIIFYYRDKDDKNNDYFDDQAKKVRQLREKLENN